MVELQKIVLKLKVIENNQFYGENTPFDMKLREVYNQSLFINHNQSSFCQQE